MKSMKFEVEVGLHKLNADGSSYYTETDVMEVQISEDRMRREDPRLDGMTYVTEWEEVDEYGVTRSSRQLLLDNPSWVETGDGLWRPMTPKEIRREWFEIAINDTIRKRAKEDGYCRADQLFSVQSRLTPDFLAFGHNLRDVYYSDNNGTVFGSIPVTVLKAEEI